MRVIRTLRRGREAVGCIGRLFVTGRFVVIVDGMEIGNPHGCLAAAADYATALGLTVDWAT